MAMQLIADLYGCDREILNSKDRIRELADKAIKRIGAEIVEECVHQFEPIGITYFAIISTSHFSVHTWPEHGYAAIDVFSCSEIVVEKLIEELKSGFSAEKIKTTIIERQVGNDER